VYGVGAVKVGLGLAQINLQLKTMVKF